MVEKNWKLWSFPITLKHWKTFVPGDALSSVLNREDVINDVKVHYVEVWQAPLELQNHQIFGLVEQAVKGTGPKDAYEKVKLES